MLRSLPESVLIEFGAGFSASKKQADSAIEQVSDDDLFRVIDPESNSIAVIMRHCAGNMRSRWRDFLSTDGEKPDRARDREFEAPPERSRQAVTGEWEDGWRRAFAAVEALTADDLLKDVSINGERMTVITAVGRATRHYAAHTGQIILLAKHFRGAQWTTLSVPRGQSDDFFRRTRK